MKYIHQACLRGWLNSKKEVKSTPHSVTYSWKSFICELCKSEYDEWAQVKYDLLAYENPYKDNQHLILESVNTNSSKNIHILKMTDKEEFKIGRGHDNDIRISDISVSRFHAMIKKDGNEYVLFDNNSKFGTLAQVIKPLCLSQYSSIHLQVGRTLMQISMRDKHDWSLNGCLWLRQDNTIVKTKRGKKYLNESNLLDDMIPKEFKNLSKSKAEKSPIVKEEKVMWKKLKSVPLEQPLSKAPDFEQKLQDDIGIMEYKQYWESCPGMTIEVEQIDNLKSVSRNSL